MIATEPFNLNGHPVTRVAVMGIIVEALPRPRHLALSGSHLFFFFVLLLLVSAPIARRAVDDGTGRIQCAYYANSVDEGGVSYSDLQVILRLLAPVAELITPLTRLSLPGGLSGQHSR